MLNLIDFFIRHKKSKWIKKTNDNDKFQPFQIYVRGFKIKKFGPWILTTPLLGYFTMSEIGLFKIYPTYPCTEFEVSNFTRSKFRLGF